MSINARCGSCNRELLVGQLLLASDGFRCPVCGFAFALGYATVAPGVAARVMAAQQALVTALAELGSMTGDRLRLDQATIVDPIASTLPEIEAEVPALARRRHAHRWARGAAPLPAQPSPTGEPASSTKRPARCLLKESPCRISSPDWTPFLRPTVPGRRAAPTGRARSGPRACSSTAATPAEQRRPPPRLLTAASQPCQEGHHGPHRPSR
jgi:hypothetical protein